MNFRPFGKEKTENIILFFRNSWGQVLCTIIIPANLKNTFAGHLHHYYCYFGSSLKGLLAIQV